jgi:hypothetical protein
MSGSGASNLGYGGNSPFVGNPALVNQTGSNNPANFSSNEINGCPGLVGAKDNIAAANGIIPGLKGGAKKLKRKIKNITKQYKRMKGGSRKIKNMKHSIRRRFISRGRSSALAGGRSRKRWGGKSRSQKGGRYDQYLSNVPTSVSYGIGGVYLPPNLSALAPYYMVKNPNDAALTYKH